jgi:lysophospholipase L1-like esterase
LKNIFCYGDSITWGFDPDTWARYEYADRWTSVLQDKLGDEYFVTVNALQGRTTAWEHPFLPLRNGRDHLMMLLESNAPLDLVIVMLGTNDIISMLKLSAEESSSGMLSLIRIIYQSLSGPDGKIPKIMIISPPVIGNLSGFMSLYYNSRKDESKKLADYHKTFSEQFGCSFINSNDFIKVCEPDGLHISRDSQKILGLKVAEEVKKILT